MSSTPWTEKWEIVSDLSDGGQGKTKIVTAIGEGISKQHGVLKILRDQDNGEARRRMFREVTNLVALNSASCRVPKVLDSNVDKFDLPSVPLYFVMEFIAGTTLSKYVKEQNGLPLEKAVDIAKSLASTISIAQKEEILHRDLKPENIIVRLIDTNEGSPQKPEVVIVDYGLSFNRRDDSQLTRTSETLDNSFLSLPERRVPGGNRRDSRSDITGLCGILYFCLTCHPPVDLVGPDNKPPHRRTGHSIREKLGPGIQSALLDSFFDRGFSANLDTRFQSIDEFSSRLEEVLSPKIRTSREAPETVARKAGQALLETNRKSQLIAFQSSGTALPNLLTQRFNYYHQSNRLAPFRIDQSIGIKGNLKVIPDYEPIGVEFFCGLVALPHTIRMNVSYQIQSRAFECTVFRGMIQSDNGNYTMIQPWQPLIRYDGRTQPDFSALVQDFDATISDAIEALQRAIQESP